LAAAFSRYTPLVQGIIVSWNPGAQRLKGYSAEEVLGRHFSIFYPPEDAAKPETELQIARTQGKYAEEGWRLRKDGTRFVASVVITAIRDGEGRLRGFSKVCFVVCSFDGICVFF
jgi:PAS domain S-box-containing protein